MSRRSLLKKINSCLIEKGINDMDLVLDIIDIVENENLGQLNISAGNSSINATQNNTTKYNITGGNIGTIGDIKK